VTVKRPPKIPFPPSYTPWLATLQLTAPPDVEWFYFINPEQAEGRLDINFDAIGKFLLEVESKDVLKSAKAVKELRLLEDDDTNNSSNANNSTTSGITNTAVTSVTSGNDNPQRSSFKLPPHFDTKPHLTEPYLIGINTNPFMTEDKAYIIHHFDQDTAFRYPRMGPVGGAMGGGIVAKSEKSKSEGVNPSSLNWFLTSKGIEGRDSEAVISPGFMISKGAITKLQWEWAVRRQEALGKAGVEAGEFDETLGGGVKIEVGETENLEKEGGVGFHDSDSDNSGVWHASSNGTSESVHSEVSKNSNTQKNDDPRKPSSTVPPPSEVLSLLTSNLGYEAKSFTIDPVYELIKLMEKSSSPHLAPAFSASMEERLRLIRLHAIGYRGDVANALEEERKSKDEERRARGEVVETSDGAASVAASGNTNSSSEAQGEEEEDTPKLNEEGWPIDPRIASAEAEGIAEARAEALVRTFSRKAVTDFEARGILARVELNNNDDDKPTSDKSTGDRKSDAGAVATGDARSGSKFRSSWNSNNPDMRLTVAVKTTKKFHTDRIPTLEDTWAKDPRLRVRSRAFYYLPSGSIGSDWFSV
jgi:hypothetical protein